ncbi:uncharacterized protein G2W53_014003 [Senna tora]|uniref:Uncharacterized protein n=1 Tax=Senna tora TaxID=362788 RepID=A0A834U2X6_9FABA|nr:uncharacterized protein G2W53_014003 [Senna tora]
MELGMDWGYEDVIFETDAQIVKIDAQVLPLLLPVNIFSPLRESEKTAKKLRKESKAAKQTLEASISAEQLEILSDLSTLFAEGNPICESMAEEKTLREHAAPQVNQALFVLLLLPFKHRWNSNQA